MAILRIANLEKTDVEDFFTEQQKEHAQLIVEHEQILQQNHFFKNELQNAEKIWTSHFDLKASKYLAEHNRLTLDIQALVADLSALEQEQKNITQAHAAQLAQIDDIQSAEIFKFREAIQELNSELSAAKQEQKQLQCAYVDDLAKIANEHTGELSKLSTSLAELASKLTDKEEEKSLQSRQFLAQSGLLLRAKQEIELLKKANKNAENHQIQLTQKIERVNAEFADLLLSQQQQDQAFKQNNNASQLKILSLSETIDSWKLTAAGSQFEIDAIKGSKLWKFSKLVRVLFAKIFASDFAIGILQKPNFFIQSVIHAQDLAVIRSDTNEATVKKNELMILKAAASANKEEIQMTNVNDLLDLHGESFLTQAYRIILGRNPDPGGLVNYMAKLKSGTSKLELLAQLAASQEAKKIGSKFPGLQEITRRHKYSKLPFMGWYKPATEQLSRKLNVIENKLFEINSSAPSSRVAMLESEIAQHASYVEDKETYIARLLQSTSKSYLTWDQFSSQILAHREGYKGIFIQEITIDWDVPLYQRPQHIASALGRLGYLVIYRIANWTNDRDNGFRQVAKNVWLTAAPEVDVIEGAVHSFYSTAFSIAPELISQRKASHRVIYEYIDHIDPQISGDAENIKRLFTLKDFAFNGGADFIVASAKLLESEAIEAVGKNKVVLVQNGVDTTHYRNPVHLSTTLPDNLIDFRKRYSCIVGYFGALAPWLWYEAISELVMTRPDLGFVFIGPDYYGGSEKLPVANNVLYLGTVNYKILPAYARQFDVCFIPFAPSEIARTTSPLKLFEYFALEKPVVVTSEMTECIAFPEVFRGDSASSLSQAIDKAIAIKSNPDFMSRLAVLADENSWEARAKAMEIIFQNMPVTDAVLAKPHLSPNSIKLNSSAVDLLDGDFHRDICTKFAVSEAFSRLYFSKQTLAVGSTKDWESLQVTLNSLQKMHVEFAMSSVQRGEQVFNLLKINNCIHKQGRYLDVGTGYGGFLRAFKKNGYSEVVGVELQPHLVELASANVSDVESAKVLKVDFDKDSLADLGKFDLITCNDVIEHVKQPELTISKIASLLADKGVACLEIPNKDCIAFVKSDGHFQLFAINQLERTSAAAYYKEATGYSEENYLFEMGEFYTLDWYFEKIEKLGLTPRIFDTHQTSNIKDVTNLIADLKSTYEMWKNQAMSKFSQPVAHSIVRAMDSYIFKIDRDYMAIKDKSSESYFIDTYLRTFWTVASKK